MDDRSDIEPRFIDTLDEQALELPSGESVPLGQRSAATRPDAPAAAGEAARVRKDANLTIALDKYWRSRASILSAGADDGPITPIGPIDPIWPTRPTPGFGSEPEPGDGIRRDRL